MGRGKGAAKVSKRTHFIYSRLYSNNIVTLQLFKIHMEFNINFFKYWLNCRYEVSFSFFLFFLNCLKLIKSS